MKLTTTQLKKHIKKHGVTKARISEDYTKTGYTRFPFWLDDSNNLRVNTTFTDFKDIDWTDYKGIFEIDCPKCNGKGYRTELKEVRDLGYDLERGKTYSSYSGKQVDTFIDKVDCECKIDDEEDYLGKGIAD